jgi:hypothetical protein
MGIRLAGIIAIATWSVTLAAFDFIGQRETLRGLGPVAVVADADVMSQVEGLPASLIELLVPLQLREAGVPVAEEGGESAFLLVRVRSTPSADRRTYAYELDMQLVQSVMIRRLDREIRATTWSASARGVVESGKFDQVLRPRLGDLVGQFTADYLSVNPKP